MDYEYEDYYYHGRAPSPPRPRYVDPRPPRRGGAFLNPEPPYGVALHRSRSTGNRPIPQINIYNDQHAEQVTRAPIYPPASPEPRGRPEERDRFNEGFLAAQLEDLRIDRLARSRSRGKSDAPMYEHVHTHTHRDPSPNYYKWQLEQREKEIKAAEQKKYWENEEKRMKTEFELQMANAEAKRKQAADAAEEERKRILEAYQAKREREDAKRREEEDAAAKERARIIADHQKDEADRVRREKDEERRLLEKIAREKREAEEREAEEWARFEQKQRDRKEQQEKQAKEEKEKIDNEMRARLSKAGYSPEQIELMIEGKKDKKKEKKHRFTEGPDDFMFVEDGAMETGIVRMPVGAPTVPVYAKIHKKYLDVQTLRYYNIPWEWDRANSEYIIILQEMSKEETDILFEHTRRMRKGNLLLPEPPKKRNKELAWVRKRDRSKSIGRRDVRLIEVRR